MRGVGELAALQPDPVEPSRRFRRPNGLVRRNHPLPAVAVVVLVALGAIASCSTSRHVASVTTTDTLKGFVQQPPQEVGSVTLPDASRSNSPFAMKAPTDDLLLVYFGYTSCPDICPTTLANLRLALRRLGARATRVEVAMVSVDPRRDTGPVLTSFVQGFIPGAHALRTDDPNALRAAADPFGVDFSVTVKADGSEDVDHTSFVYVVDSAGVVRDNFAFKTPPASIANDLDILLRRAR